MGRLPKCVNAGLKKGAWTSEEDRKLVSFIQRHGHGSWCSLPAKAGLQRCGKSCRLRWINYLRSDINRGKFSLEEEQSIIQLHALVGNKWSCIASYLSKRTDNDIKNYWNTCLKKRLSKMGVDPSTHKPKVCHLGGFDTANLISHMAQWESARLQAESRLAVKSTSNFSAPSLKGWQPWRRSINSGFFNPSGTLPSPTSILNFSDKAGVNGATTIFTASTSVGDVIVPPFSTNMIAKEETINDDIIADLSAKPLVEPPRFLEGFNSDDHDLPFGHASFCDTGYLEDNRRYWSCVLSELN